MTDKRNVECHNCNINYDPPAGLMKIAKTLTRAVEANARALEANALAISKIAEAIKGPEALVKIVEAES